MDDSGDPVDSRMIHVVWDTTWGCALRSRFILGVSAHGDNEPSVTDEVCLGLLHYCHCEFASLS
ncbi:hypothetical protein ID852_08355 [Xenorhabdus sp. 42]|uniref:hypothetical protein n=1 Tax=Xenorhabdus szentirmaii TaxID=290112 RepID=UPI00198D860E|nr:MULTISPECIES: hypothetical protein [unclassified Xenorhabdus]MBD2790704.1 hypothetical protein [Xenorhabdus sp. CUL]MBD2820705.1 hypothetical protein [Xenorhabdus sp. 42]MBD2824052.1 hypothetical protein [Xenorhabdus sp. 5]